MTTPATYPGYPPQPQQTAPGWGQQPQYAPPQFAPGYPPAQPAAPQQPLAQGTIDDYFAQRSSGGGKSLSFQSKPVGTTYVGVVTRAITQGDIQQQTNIQGVPQFFRDGRPKFVMTVPLQMQPSPDYPDGLAQWYVKGQARDELVRAMGEAGAPAGPPEAGAILQITLTGQRPSGPGLNPANLFHVTYTRPDGQTSSPAPQQQAQAQPPQAQYAAPSAQPYVPPQQPTTPQAQPAAQAAPQPQQPAAAPAGELTDEQRQLLARLTGQQG